MQVLRACETSNPEIECRVVTSDEDGQATKDYPSGLWNLHQLRHSALTHAAETGAYAWTLLAYSAHRSVASLARYARVSQRPQPLAARPRPGSPTVS
ncbi:hypothetical protein [Actinopolymorpha sp. B9G3]|uniref:hypothetical protein n=1 Tax=Actinopolymorpha sp. B9G3 TaxID=3158970 RepID=UPI0032D8EEEE